MSKTEKQQIALGILAHVDAGKTTLSEALLYRGGQTRTLGRVDHKNAFLDTDPLERERGITIFSKPARLPLETMELTLVDTPGHADFSAETERVLRVLDCAVLVISGTDGIQGHTLTLWRLLEHYGVPTFLFVNKMDLAGADRAQVLAALQSRLSEGCLDFTAGEETLQEQMAELEEAALEEYLADGQISPETRRRLVAERRLFPCFFGSALKLDGVEALVQGIEACCPLPRWGSAFGARVYKISRDEQGKRLTWLRVTGGTLAVKTPLKGKDWEEKVEQIRLYSGEKAVMTDCVSAGTVCAVTGLSHTYAGMGLGVEQAAEPPMLESVLTYRLLPPEGCDLHALLGHLRRLEEEDPQLHVLWESESRAIQVRLMGPIQLEVLQWQLADRFGVEVAFGQGAIVYRETIAAPVEGIGHYEPLRHYAEVHLLLEPGAPGSGLVFATDCSEDALDRNWQRLILTHLMEIDHPGVLTGSPITDMKLTLVAGRAHEKHTEGGDFRQATYRAVRQGLMCAESRLLEPWYAFRLEIPAEQVGRAMTDLQRMGGEVEPPETLGAEVLLTGRAPVAGLRDYGAEVISYTRGRGRLNCSFQGYLPCQNPEEVITARGYDPERDVEHPADSIFCSHGAGHVVKWNEVPALAHVDSGLSLGETTEEAAVSPAPTPRRREAGGSLEQDKELMAIFERTYGKVTEQTFQPQKKPARTSLSERYTIRDQPKRMEYLLVDGYNIIFAWEDLKALAQTSLTDARAALIDLLCNYQGFRKCEVIVVFDAYKVARHAEEVVKHNNIYLVYTREAETADSYIERTTYDLSREHRVRVATSDGLEQFIILGHGALRLSATAFRAEIEQMQGEIGALLKQTHLRPSGIKPVKEAMRRAEQRQTSRKS